MTMELPPLEIFSGDWQSYENELYEIFLDTVVRAGIAFQGLPVKSQFRPETQGKGFSFWHLISEGENEDERTPDFRRCERIRWISWLINNVDSVEEISWWENRRGSNTHVVLWVEVERFAIVLAKRNGYYLIKTAYMVKSNREKSFRKERERFWRSRKD